MAKKDNPKTAKLPKQVVTSKTVPTQTKTGKALPYSDRQISSSNMKKR